MNKCKNLIVEDITPWHGDVFDHPSYKYTCKLTSKEILHCAYCNTDKMCENYEPLED